MSLKDLVDRETEAYMNRRSMIVLEAAVSCLLDTKTAPEAAKILREFADRLEEYL